MKLKLGHIALRVADEDRSRAFYTEVLGLDVSEQDPEHGGTFMTNGGNFHTMDVFPHNDAAGAQKPHPDQVGLFHIAFQVESYGGLKETYESLMAHGVPLSHATDHVSQRSLYFSDPDGNRLEVYYEIPDALERYATEGRGDNDVPLAISKPGEPLPAWLDEAWPDSAAFEGSESNMAAIGGAE